MDYDQTEIATSHDKARALAPETVRLWQDLLSAHVDPAPTSVVVDLGCGTGRFSQLLAAHFGVEVIGIDPSQEMIGQARRKPAAVRVSYRQGVAEAIPLPNSCADLVFMSNIYHHLSEQPAAARECHRVLRQGGSVLVRNSTREADFPHRHFFPGLGVSDRLATAISARQKARIRRRRLRSGDPPGRHAGSRAGLAELY